MEGGRRYGSSASEGPPPIPPNMPSTSEDLHAWYDFLKQFLVGLVQSLSGHTNQIGRLGGPKKQY